MACADVGLGGRDVRDGGSGDVEGRRVPALESDYSLLFDGSPKTGWQQSGPGEVRVEDGSLVTYGGLGLLWYAAQQYGDFSLKLSWKVEDGTDNSGVFVRFPDADNVSDTAINGARDPDPRGREHLRAAEDGVG